MPRSIHIKGVARFVPLRVGTAKHAASLRNQGHEI
jgi:hypothetical protein